MAGGAATDGAPRRDHGALMAIDTPPWTAPVHPVRTGGIARRPVATAAVLLGYLALAALLTAGAWRDPTGRLLGGAQDAIQHIWFLAWLPYALGHGLDPLLTRFLDHPGPVNLMWNNATPLLAALAAPITLTAGPIAAYAALLTAAVAGSAFAAYLLAARLVQHRAAAIVAGLAYGFSPYVVAQATGAHLPLATVPGPPLLGLALHELAARRRTDPRLVGLGVGLLLWAQLLTNEELLLTQTLMGIVALALVAAFHPTRLRQGACALRRAATPALGTFVVLAALPLWIQLAGPGRLGGGAVQPPGRYVTDLLGLVVPTQILHFAPPGAIGLTRHFTANLSEWDGYLGIPLLALAAAAPFLIRRRWAWVAAGVGVVALACSLGPALHVGGRTWGIPLPWTVLGRLPGLRDVLPDRLTVYAFLAAALLLAGVLDRVLAHRPRPAAWAAGLGVAGAALVPLVPRGPLPSEPARVPAFFTTAAVDRLPPGQVAVVAPAAWGPDDVAMLWQAASAMRFTQPFGYVLHPGPHGGAAADPPRTMLVAVLHQLQAQDPPRLPPLALRRLRRELVHLRVRAVVVGPMPGRGQTEALLARLLGRPPLRVGGVDLWTIGRQGTRA